MTIVRIVLEVDSQYRKMLKAEAAEEGMTLKKYIMYLIETSKERKEIKNPAK